MLSLYGSFLNLIVAANDRKAVTAVFRNMSDSFDWVSHTHVLSKFKS